MKTNTLKFCLVLLAVSGMSASAATVAHWDFEEGTPGMSFAAAGGAVDITGNGNTIWGWDDYWGPSFYAGSPTSNISARHADNHQDGYTDAAPVNSWSPTEWTIEVAVMLKDIGGWKTIIGRDGSTSGDSFSDLYLQNNGIDNRFRIDFDTVGGLRYVLDSSIIPVANKWYGLAVTCDGTTLTMYVDEGWYNYVSVGSLALDPLNDNALAQIGQNWTFGRGWWGGSFVDHIDGNLDDIRFSDVALAREDLIGIPEPATLLMLGVGALAMFKKRKRAL